MCININNPKTLNLILNLSQNEETSSRSKNFVRKFTWFVLIIKMQSKAPES